MSDSKARSFLEDILAHPDDDAPRLIFADWLEEQGDSARAELIRVQVERATLPVWDARQVRLKVRERKLLAKHGRKWKGELPVIKGVTWEELRRGFVATATFSSFGVLRANAGVCWAAAPIEAVSVRWPNSREGILSSEGLIEPIAGLRELFLTARLVARPDAARLFASPLLSTLRTLTIREANMGAAGFLQLAASPHLGSLRTLRLPGNSIGNAGMSALFDAVSLTSLSELDLSETDSYGRYGEDWILDPTGVEALAEWSGMARLRSLTLSGNEVGQDGLGALLRSPNASSLKELVLRGSGLTQRAMQEFGAAVPQLQLDILDLGQNLLRSRGAEYLAHAACLRELKVLALDSCELELRGARDLAKAPFLGSLRRLNVDHNSFGPKGLHTLLGEQPQQLHTLQLVNNDLGEEGVSDLAESPVSDTLLELDLGQNELGESAAQALGKAKHLQSLLILGLSHNRLSKQAAAALRRSPLGKRLAILEVTKQWNDEIPF